MDKEIKNHSGRLLGVFDDGDPFKAESISFILGDGKRFRPSLAYFVANEFSVFSPSTFISLEIYHKFLLVHDDIIDRDSLRYGKKTVHESFKELHPDTTEENKYHIGVSSAIVAGDIMAAESILPIIDDAVISDKIKVDLVRLLASNLVLTGKGEYRQFLQDYKKISDVSEKDIRDSLILVTGKYTTEFPVKFGLTLAERQDLMSDILSDACDSIGVIFQATDDYLGVFGDTSTSGKSNYSDLIQGKKTFILYFGYKKASRAERQFLDEKIGGQISIEDMEKIKEILRKGVTDYRELLKKETLAVEKSLKSLSMPVSIKQFLAGFTEFLLTRER